MDQETLAHLAFVRAMRDMFMDKGRIIISEFKKDIGQQSLTATELVEALRAFYPQYDIDQRTENIILIDKGERPTVDMPRKLVGRYLIPDDRG